MGGRALLKLNMGSTTALPKRVKYLTSAGSHKPDCFKNIAKELEGC
jgi:hypothetical protein